MSTREELIHLHSTPSCMKSWPYLKRPFVKSKPKTVATTVAEQQDAERLIFKEIQRTAFKNEITSLSQKEQNAKISKQSSRTKVGPFRR